MDKLNNLYTKSLNNRSVVLKTFHPDNALPVIGFDNHSRPIFNPNKVDSPFDDQMEIQEAIYYHKISGQLKHHRSHLMIDFERKSTDTRIISKTIHALINEQTDIKIMPRSCDIREVEHDPYRFREILTGIASANSLFKRNNNHHRIRDLIIPQVNNDRVLRAARLTIEAYRNSFKDSVEDLSDIKLVPLIENTTAMLNLRDNVFQNMQAIRGDSHEDYTRVMLAMSDTSMVSGSIACMLSLRFGLSEIYRMALENNHTLLPILGGGTLPFRGLQTPENIEQILTYLPVYQITVQSAMTFDYGEAGIQNLATSIDKAHKNYTLNIKNLLSQVEHNQKELYAQLIQKAETAYAEDLLQLSRQNLSMPIILEQYGIRAPSRRNRISAVDGGAGRDKTILGQSICFHRAIGHVFGTITAGLGSGSLLGNSYLYELQEQHPEILEQLKPLLTMYYQKDSSLASIKVAQKAENLLGLLGLSKLLEKRLQAINEVLGIEIQTDEEHESHLLSGMEAWRNGNIKYAQRHFQYAAIHRKSLG